MRHNPNSKQIFPQQIYISWNCKACAGMKYYTLYCITGIRFAFLLLFTRSPFDWNRIYARNCIVLQICRERSLKLEFRCIPIQFYIESYHSNVIFSRCFELNISYFFTPSISHISKVTSMDVAVYPVGIVLLKCLWKIYMDRPRKMRCFQRIFE